MIKRPRTKRPAVAVLVMAVAGGCHNGPEGGAVLLAGGACGPAGPPLAADGTWAHRNGEFQLTLVAPGAEGSEISVQGTLHLEANAPGDRAFTRPGSDPDPTVQVPLYGWTDIDAGQVGGRRVGELQSRDPVRPGVLVLEQRTAPGEPPSVTIRLGSQANDRSIAPFESGYFALRVAWLDDAGRFGGTWSSGLRSVEAKGHFCAEPS